MPPFCRKNQRISEIAHNAYIKGDNNQITEEKRRRSESVVSGVVIIGLFFCTRARVSQYARGLGGAVYGVADQYPVRYSYCAEYRR